METGKVCPLRPSLQPQAPKSTYRAPQDSRPRALGPGLHAADASPRQCCCKSTSRGLPGFPHLSEWLRLSCDAPPGGALQQERPEWGGQDRPPPNAARPSAGWLSQAAAPSPAPLPCGFSGLCLPAEEGVALGSGRPGREALWVANCRESKNK